MQTVITYYKNLTRWDIKSYLCLFSSPYVVEELGKYIYGEKKWCQVYFYQKVEKLIEE